MKKSIHKLICLALTISGLSFYACQQDECVEGKQQQTLVKDAVTEARNDDGSLYCNVTTTAAGQVDSLVTVLATEGDYPPEGITHLTISGPINNNDIKTMCNFLYLDSLILTDAKIEKISQNSFEYFKSKAHIVLPKTVKTIERYAFDLNYNNYNSIKSVYIQDSVKTIGEYAFYDCKGLESIHLPKNITELPEGIFRYCENLKEVTVPVNVKNIKQYAFDGCSSLTKVEIPKQVTEMGAHVFSGCSSLDSIQWPSYLRYIPDYCFDNCTNLKFEIPGYIEKIGAHAFSDCKQITEYKIPAKVETIGEYAFEGTGITTLTITDKTMLATGLFNGSAMTTLTISEGVTALSGYLFQNCGKLTNIKFPSSMKTIHTHAFNGCGNLVSIEFNEGLETIGNYAFHDNDALQSVTIPAKKIGENAFSDCNKLKDVVLKDNVETIGSYAFSSNDLIQSIIIPAKTIGYYAFAQCENLEKVVLKSGVKSIDREAFYSCEKLSEVEWNEGLETIGSSAFRYTALTEFKAPSTLKTIGDAAFYDDKSLAEIILNEGLISIEGNAFGYTPIKTINIPSTLEKCGNTIFNYCSKLTSVFWNSKISAPDLTHYDKNILLYLKNGASDANNPNRIVNGKSQTTILLRSDGDFHCPESFVSDMQYDRVFNRRGDNWSDNVSDENYYDSNYSFQNIPGQASCWQTIVLPFEVTSIKCGDKELVPFGVEKEGTYPFWLRELTPNGFVRATKIEANKPYIIAMPNNEAYADEYNIRGKVSFYAENVTIPVTEGLKEVQGPKFNFYPTYTWLGKNAERLVLNRIDEYYDSKQRVDYYYGSAFVASQYDLGAFGAYVSSPAGGRSVVPIESALSSRRTHKLGPIPQENDM
ncbi:MAG: leucine-rich repeat domain-containing protein [Bacteroides sp.]|nr:leucine-rich repeat domain-containing protein [Bacteroides sp.]